MTQIEERGVIRRKHMDIHADPLLALLEKTPEGVRAGDCLLTEKLGQGGMGAVYLGRHLNLRIDVAIKVLPFHVADTDSTAVARFLKEARSTVRIDHPNIVRVFDVKEERGVHYLVMEHVDGESADARLKREGSLPERDALEIAIAAGEALAAAHAKGILHRDVKPSNILIRFEDGRVKLADLGLAKALGTEAEATGGLTATGQMLGTPAYMSPEQAEDASRADERTDIYSLGATLYALLSGKAPFEATQLYKLLHQVITEEPEKLRSLRPDVTENTAATVKGLMAKNPAERLQWMIEAVRVLRECLAQAPKEDARGLARPEMAGSRKVVDEEQAPATAVPRERTLDDVTPSQARRFDEAHRGRESERGHDAAESRFVSPEARSPIAVRMRKGRKVATILGILAALGAAGGSAAYLYSQRRASDARLAEEERGRQEKLAEERRRLDEEETRAERRREYVRKRIGHINTRYEMLPGFREEIQAFVSRAREDPVAFITFLAWTTDPTRHPYKPDVKIARAVVKPCQAELQEEAKRAAAEKRRAEAERIAKFAWDRLIAKDYMGAIVDVSKAIDLDPKNPKMYGQRAAAYWALGFNAEAIADCTRAIEIDSTFAAAYNLRGLVYRAMGENARAEADFRRAAELDPANFGKR